MFIPSRFEASYSESSQEYTTVTGGSAHTKGSYTELIASTGDTTGAIQIIGAGVSAGGTDTRVLMDISTGAAASEVVLVPDIMMGNAWARTPVSIPVNVASSTRISTRIQGTQASETLNLHFAALQDIQQLEPATAVESVGATTADSGGTSVTPGTGGSWGTWTSVGTISADRNVFYPRCDLDGDTAVASGSEMVLELGYGSSAPGSGGTALTGIWMFAFDSGSEGIYGPFPNTPIYADLTSGETLWARLSTTDAAVSKGVTVLAMECAAAAGGGIAKLAGHGGGLVG